jgi:hypothetical protein
LTCKSGLLQMKYLGVPINQKDWKTLIGIQLEEKW